MRPIKVNSSQEEKEIYKIIENQKQLSKEFVREWLMENGFQGKENQQVPKMDKNLVDLISNRYIELFEKVSGLKFEMNNTEDAIERIEQNILKFLKK